MYDQEIDSAWDMGKGVLLIELPTPAASIRDPRYLVEGVSGQ